MPLHSGQEVTGSAASSNVDADTDTDADDQETQNII